MLSFICLFFPPIVMLYLIDTSIKNIKSLKEYVLYYSISVLLTHGISIFILSFIFNSNSSLTETINQYNIFALKYMLLSCTIAIILPKIIAYFYPIINNVNTPPKIIFCPCKRYGLLLS